MARKNKKKKEIVRFPKQYKEKKTQENWRTISGYEPSYQVKVSDYGRVIILPEFKTDKDGREFVHLAGRDIPVDLMVAQAFIPNYTDSEVPIHRNGDMKDSRVSNLMWLKNGEDPDVPGRIHSTINMLQYILNPSMLAERDKEFTKFYTYLDYLWKSGQLPLEQEQMIMESYDRHRRRVTENWVAQNLNVSDIEKKTSICDTDKKPETDYTPTPTSPDSLTSQDSTSLYRENGLSTSPESSSSQESTEQTPSVTQPNQESNPDSNIPPAPHPFMTVPKEILAQALLDLYDRASDQLASDSTSVERLNVKTLIPELIANATRRVVNHGPYGKTSFFMEDMNTAQYFIKSPDSGKYFFNPYQDPKINLGESLTAPYHLNMLPQMPPLNFKKEVPRTSHVQSVLYGMKDGCLPDWAVSPVLDSLPDTILEKAGITPELKSFLKSLYPDERPYRNQSSDAIKGEFSDMHRKRPVSVSEEEYELMKDLVDRENDNDKSGLETLYREAEEKSEFFEAMHQARRIEKGSRYFECGNRQARYAEENGGKWLNREHFYKEMEEEKNRKDALYRESLENGNGDRLSSSLYRENNDSDVHDEAKSGGNAGENAGSESGNENNRVNVNSNIKFSFNGLSSGKNNSVENNLNGKNNSSLYIEKENKNEKRNNIDNDLYIENDSSSDSNSSKSKDDSESEVNSGSDAGSSGGGYWDDEYDAVVTVTKKKNAAYNNPAQQNGCVSDSSVSESVRDAADNPEQQDKILSLYREEDIENGVYTGDDAGGKESGAAMANKKSSNGLYPKSQKNNPEQQNNPSLYREKKDDFGYVIHERRDKVYSREEIEFLHLRPDINTTPEWDEKGRPMFDAMGRRVNYIPESELAEIPVRQVGKNHKEDNVRYMVGRDPEKYKQSQEFIKYMSSEGRKIREWDGTPAMKEDISPLYDPKKDITTGIINVNVGLEASSYYNQRGQKVYHNVRYGERYDPEYHTLFIPEMYMFPEFVSKHLQAELYISDYMEYLKKHNPEIGDPDILRKYYETAKNARMLMQNMPNAAKNALYRWGTGRVTRGWLPDGECVLFESIAEASRATGVPQAQIAACIRGEKPNAYGIRWELCDVADMDTMINRYIKRVMDICEENASVDSEKIDWSEYMSEEARERLYQKTKNAVAPVGTPAEEQKKKRAEFRERLGLEPLYSEKEEWNGDFRLPDELTEGMSEDEIDDLGLVSGIEDSGIETGGYSDEEYEDSEYEEDYLSEEDDSDEEYSEYRDLDSDAAEKAGKMSFHMSFLDDMVDDMTEGEKKSSMFGIESTEGKKPSIKSRTGKVNMDIKKIRKEYEKETGERLYNCWVKKDRDEEDNNGE